MEGFYFFFLLFLSFRLLNIIIDCFLIFISATAVADWVRKSVCGGKIKNMCLKLHNQTEMYKEVCKIGYKSFWLQSDEFSYILHLFVLFVADYTRSHTLSLYSVACVGVGDGGSIIVVKLQLCP